MGIPGMSLGVGQSISTVNDFSSCVARPPKHCLQDITNVDFCPIPKTGLSGYLGQNPPIKVYAMLADCPENYRQQGRGRS